MAEALRGAGTARTLGTLALLALVFGFVVRGPASTQVRADDDPRADDRVAGSRSCRECHERFYELWAPSHHGTAMQPFAADLPLPATEAPVTAGDRAYDFERRGDRGYVVERGGDAPVSREVLHVMGGKNVYFLLTPAPRGRLQVLPIAYDVRAEEWYDTTASMVRHAGGTDDRPVDWTDSLLTFNTSCWSCHVSQLSINYDLESDSYDSRWVEPGINCETCHGPAGEHVRVCREAPPGTVPDDLAIRRFGAFTPEQMNDACSTCHAKAVVVSDTFQPGERFFDHFDLVTLEHPDFHPDGRDLGENYTLTSWRMSPCVKAGELDCIHCHTSSGRYRFPDDDGACLPCHADHVEDPSAHTHHAADSAGSRCVSCHMPMTSFARMRRSDHSMRPPAPSLTQAHGSPNACNLCHDDQDAAWADTHVRAWRTRDYQAPMLHAADLVAKARRGELEDLDAMVAAIRDPDREEILATSLLRLLARTTDRRVAEAALGALEDPSPLLRATAAAVLEPYAAVPAVATGLVAALEDDVRLVRIRAAGALAGLPAGELPAPTQAALERATAELLASWTTRPDQWDSHFNLGNFHDRRGEDDLALEAYATASRLRPDQIAPRVNAAMVHARAGRLEDAERLLRDALEVDAGSAEAHFNLGLLCLETDRHDAGRRHLELAFEADPQLVRAAINLAILAAQAEDLEGAVRWSGRAVEADATDARAAGTHAYYLVLAEQFAQAVDVLERALDAGAVSPDVYDLLGRIHVQSGAEDAARRVWAQARDDPRLPARARAAFAARLR